MKTQTAPGWYPDPDRIGTRRYWDGQEWTDHIAPATAQSGTLSRPNSPIGLVIGGFLLGVLGSAFLIGAGSEGDVVLAFVGWAISGVGAIMVAVGVVAAGVRLGIQHADYERQQRAR